MANKFKDGDIIRYTTGHLKKKKYILKVEKALATSYKLRILYTDYRYETVGTCWSENNLSIIDNNYDLYEDKTFKVLFG